MALPRRCLPRLRATGSLAPQPAQRRHLSIPAGSELGPAPRIYTSHSDDPYLNLSIEHHLLQTSHPASTVLFLYRNRPAIVIGRNQNPWVEADLARLRRRGGDGGAASLVRRRSGGGAVFHDGGNANWAVVCPAAAFDRDRHAEMVARALRRLGAAAARVNARHDIVLGDGGDGGGGGGGALPPKVSGSAYKLTRARSLHHGTCLLASPNLDAISAMLRSPAEPFIKARGVESVRSRVGNVGLGYGEFVEAVKEEFRGMYGPVEGGGAVTGPDMLQSPAVKSGFDELRSPEWIFGQTPLFTFSTHPTEDDERERPALPRALPRNFRLSFSARHGQIQDASVSGLAGGGGGGGGGTDSAARDRALGEALVGKSIHHVADWRGVVRTASPVPAEADAVGEWLNDLFSVGDVNRHVA